MYAYSKASGQRETGKVGIICIKYLPSGLYHPYQLDVHVSMSTFSGVLNTFSFQIKSELQVYVFMRKYV